MRRFGGQTRFTGLPRAARAPHDRAIACGRPAMNEPTPSPPPSRPQPRTLEESAEALLELRLQMQKLNAQLEYLRLILKLGVR
jgi:hypothetical protein